MKSMDREPVITPQLIVAAFAALINILFVAGVPISLELVAALNAFIAVIAAPVAALIARSYVDSPKTKRKKQRDYFGH